MSVSSYHTSEQASSAHIRALNSKWRSSVWLETFVLFQIACQILLLFGSTGTMRVTARTAAYGGSILLLLILPTRRGIVPHPATPAAQLVLLILTLSFFHPMINNFESGGAQVLLYFAILAPLFWVPRLQINPIALRRVMLILWLFHTVSAGVGVLQIYYPGSFQPNVSQVVANSRVFSGLYITLASGQRVLRPMGLTDMPGGAATAGFYALIFGMGFFLTSRRFWIMTACVGGMTLGMICLYTAQVRSMLVMAAFCVLAFCGLLFWNRHGKRLILLIVVLIIITVSSFTWAVLIGGKNLTDRLNTLVESQPSDIYYRNRGVFLQHTIDELLPLYPLGAGLGRWGMTNAYFGDNSDPDRGHIHVEIQWTGWLLDGGIPLILVYSSAVILALLTAWKVARKFVSSNDGDMPIWGALLLAYDVGAVALTFNYPVFIGQLGLEFWLFNAALFATARSVYPQLNRPGKL